MADTMKTAIMHSVNEVSIEDRPIPKPKDDEVLVKLGYVGICGSDLHYYEKGRIGNFIVEPPFVLGHEAAGTVVEVGKGVKHLKVGDRVALEPGKTCGQCEFCKSGKYNLCPDVIFFATPPVDGVFQEYVAHEAALCFKLPDNVSTLEGALIEPLAIGFHAARQGKAQFGQTALITGCGCIGLVTLLALKTLGVTTIYMADVMQNRLDKAAELGATEVINGAKEDTVKRIYELTDGRGVDLTIETSGAEVCARQCVEALRKGGTMVQVGYSPSGDMNMPMGMVCDKEIKIKSVFRYHHIYPLAIKAVETGKVDLKSIVTSEFTLDDIQNAMDQSVKNKAEIVKAVVKISDDN